MNGFVKGMVLGVVAGAAADMALRTAQGKRTAAGKAMQAWVGKIPTGQPDRLGWSGCFGWSSKPETIKIENFRKNPGIFS